MNKDKPDIVPASAEKPDSLAQAKALVAAQEQAVVKACNEEIQAVLEKHGCVIGAVPTVIPAGGAFALGANVVIQARPKE